MEERFAHRVSSEMPKQKEGLVAKLEHENFLFGVLDVEEAVSCSHPVSEW